jgi:hypothetical protein
MNEEIKSTRALQERSAYWATINVLSSMSKKLRPQSYSKKHQSNQIIYAFHGFVFSSIFPANRT